MKISIHPAPGSDGLRPDPVLLDAVPGTRMQQAIWLSGLFNPVPLCGGLARCGRCRVRYLTPAPAPLPEEESVLGPEAVRSGWRLACHRQIPDGGPVPELELPDTTLAGEEKTAAHPSLSGGAETCVLAVDLGTTGIAWRALAGDGDILAGGSALNPQEGAGADVMSRLAYASQGNGMTVLAECVRRLLRSVVSRLPVLPRLIVLAGNTAMTDIFLEKDISGLCAAPYHLSHAGGAVFELPGLPPVYVPPLAAPFIGGDVTAGVCALLSEGQKLPWVLADLGTNGEFVLMREDGTCLATSVPLGPALEGIGPDCGRLAGPGTITSFVLTPFGPEPRLFEGGTLAPGARAAGISATGYLSLLALLLKTGFLLPEGQFSSDSGSLQPLARRLLSSLDRKSAVPRLMLPGNVWLSLSDVEEILKVKAAFSVALDSLLSAAGEGVRSRVTLCIAGALGEHADPGDLETLGFIPSGMAGAVRAVGNTSLEGAGLLGLHQDLRERLSRMCADISLLRPDQEQNFHRRYIDAMHFGG